MSSHAFPEKPSRSRDGSSPRHCPDGQLYAHLYKVLVVNAGLTETQTRLVDVLGDTA